MAREVVRKRRQNDGAAAGQKRTKETAAAAVGRKDAEKIEVEFNNKDQKDEEGNQIPSSVGKIPSTRQSRKHQNRASLQAAPYANLLSTTPGKNNPSINSPRTPLRTPRSATTKRQDLWDIGSPLSPKSPSMRALNAIVSFISPYASARRSAAFGEPEEEQEGEQEDRSPIWKGKQKEQSSALIEEDEDENDEEDIATSLYPPLPSDPNSSIQAIQNNDLENDTTIIEQTIDDIEEEDDDDDDDDDGSSKEGEENPSRVQIQESQQERSREMDAVRKGEKIDSQPSVLSEVKPSSRAFSFMSATRPEPSFGAPSAIGLTVSEEQPIEDSGEITGGTNSFSLPAARSPFQTNGFIAPRQSTPSRMGFGAIASAPMDSAFEAQSSPHAQELLRPSVIPPSGAFTFGVSQEASSSRLPQYPRITRSAKTVSPLAKNYELLARFFAEKAEQEARAEASTSISSMDEDGNEQTGALTEIEVAGCMRLIEQSYAHGQGEEVERLRQEALLRGQAPQVRGDDSIENRMDEDEVHFANSHISQNRRQFISRSPSLPLGAAAGEDPVAGLYGYRPQPSSSFLAPTYRDPQDLKVNQSLANIFGNSATVPPKRKHRPLYLGPGVGATATSAILRRTQQMQGRKSALTTQRASLRDQLRPLPMRKPVRNEIVEEPEDSEGPRKRRKLPEDSGMNKEMVESAVNVPTANQITKQQIAVQPSTQTPANRTATADAMLSILNSGPSIPSRSPASANYSRTSTTGSSEAESNSNPELVNPYETRSRLTRRSIIPGSGNGASTAAAKEKDRLKEEREKRLKAQKEREARKESTLDFIKRTAPSPQVKRGRQIRLDEDDEEEEEEEEAEAEKAEQQAQKASAEAEAKEKAKAAEETRKRKNEELKRRMEKMNKDAKVKNASIDHAEPKSSTQPTNSAPASKSFTFNSGFAPKKPSPLSQAASNHIPDSPSASSESSERSLAKPIASPAKVSTGPHPSSAIVIDDGPEESQEPKTNAALFSLASKEVTSSDTSKSGSGSKPAFSFTAMATKPAPSSTSQPSTSAPFSFNKPAEVQNSNASTTSSVSASTSQEPISDRAKAENDPVSTLPKFDFTLDVVLPNSLDKRDEAARKSVNSESIESLPKFDFSESVTGNKPAPAEASKTINFSAAEPVANASSTPPFSFKPVPSATSAAPSLNKDAGETPAEPGSVEKSGEDSVNASEKTKSALLAGTGEGEEDENTMHEVRCKIWNLSDGKWNDLGIGFLKIKKNKSTSKQRVLVRNEGNGKVTVNFNIMSTFKPSQDKNIVTFLGFDQTGKPTNYRCKIKTEQDAKELKESLEKSAKDVS